MAVDLFWTWLILKDFHSDLVFSLCCVYYLKKEETGRKQLLLFSFLLGCNKSRKLNIAIKFLFETKLILEFF